MTRNSEGERVNFTPATWIGLGGLVASVVLAMAAGVWKVSSEVTGVRVSMESRLTALETKVEMLSDREE